MNLLLLKEKKLVEKNKGNRKKKLQVQKKVLLL